MKMRDFLEPEEAVGTLWHGMVTRPGADATHAGAAVTLDTMQASIATLYRALGGGTGVEIGPVADGEEDNVADHDLRDAFSERPDCDWRLSSSAITSATETPRACSMTRR